MQLGPYKHAGRAEPCVGEIVLIYMHCVLLAEVVCTLQALPHLAGDRVNVHYKVKAVQLMEHEKTVFLEGTYTGEHVVVHLQDQWFDTPVEPGHKVNLIAEKAVGADGALHAVCKFEAGAHSILLQEQALPGASLTCLCALMEPCMLAANLKCCYKKHCIRQVIFVALASCMSPAPLLLKQQSAVNASSAYSNG